MNVTVCADNPIPDMDQIRRAGQQFPYEISELLRDQQVN